MDEEFENIKIPKDLFKKIESRIKNTEFKSIDEYIIFVLEEIVKEDEEQYAENSEKTLIKDEEEVKNRLKALGYLG